jgi:hypothetical protein
MEVSDVQQLRRKGVKINWKVERIAERFLMQVRPCSTSLIWKLFLVGITMKKFYWSWQLRTLPNKSKFTIGKEEFACSILDCFSPGEKNQSGDQLIEIWQENSVGSVPATSTKILSSDPEPKWRWKLTAKSTKTQPVADWDAEPVFEAQVGENSEKTNLHRARGKWD